MSRARTSTPPLIRRVVTVVALATAMLSSIAPATVSAQALAPAGDLPSCDFGRTLRDCTLPTWPQDTIDRAPSLFGAIEPGRGVWISDPAGDAPAAGLDILAVGITTIDVMDLSPIRTSGDLLTRGKPNKAVKRGPAVLVRAVLDRPIDDIEAAYSGIFIATDIDGSRTNNAPTAVRKADGPFAGLQDVYSVSYTTTTGKTKLLDSDLAKGWYKGKDLFAASRPAPSTIDVLIRPDALGAGLKVMSYVSGTDGGYDVVSIGPSAIPLDGRIGLAPVCIEGNIAAEPFTVSRLVENGQTLRNIEAPASWYGGASFAVTSDERAAMQALIDARDEDGDGRIMLPSTIALFEDGLVVRQRPDVELAIEDDQVSVAVQLGLTRRGFTILRDVVIGSTDDPVADAFLERIAQALTAVTPPFRSGKKTGPVVGSGWGSCVPALIDAPVVSPALDPDASAGPDVAVGAANDAAADL
jgi:hypothetical protein